MCFLFGGLNAQSNPAKKESDLQAVSSFMEYSWTGTSPWSVFHDMKMESSISKNVTIKGVNGLIDDYLNQKPTTDNKSQLESKQFALVKQYQANLHGLFNSIDALKGLKPNRYFHLDVPTQFALNTDGGLSLIITGADIDTVLNSDKLTLEHRTAAMLLNYILPSLKTFTTNFTGNEIKYYGLTVMYSSMSASSDKAKVEWTGFIAPVDLIKKYTADEITASKLMEKAEIYSGYNAYTDKNKKLTIDLNAPIPNAGKSAEPAAKAKSAAATDVSALTAYSGDNFSFSHPESWEKTSDPKTDVSFNLSNGAIFQISHTNAYDDVVKYAEGLKQSAENKHYTVTMENVQLGGVYAIRLTNKGKLEGTGTDVVYVYYLYKDAENSYLIGKKVSMVMFGANLSDYAKTEPQVTAALKTYKFKTKTFDFRDLYSFEYPMLVEAKIYYKGSVSVGTNCPIGKIGTLLNSFFVRVSEPQPGDKSIEDLLKQKEKEFKKEKYKNIVISDFPIGGKTARQISYVSTSGAKNGQAFIMYKGSLIWFEFNPSHDTEEAYAATVALVLGTFKFKE